MKQLDFSSLDPAYVADAAHFDKKSKPSRKEKVTFYAGLAILLTLMLIIANTPYAGIGFLLIPVAGFWIYYYFSTQSDVRNKLSFEEFLKVNNLYNIAPSKIEARPELFMPESLLEIGQDRKVDFGFEDKSHKNKTRFCQIEFTIGSGNNSITHKFSCLSLETPALLNHFLLDSKRNELLSFFSNIPRHYEQKQRISLEGDFDKYFDLYVPSGEHIDVLAVLGPDVMQSLITHSQQFDIETGKHKVYLFCSGHILFEPDILASMYKLREAIFNELKRHKNIKASAKLDSVAATSLKSGVSRTVRIGGYRVKPWLFFVTLLVSATAVGILGLIIPVIHTNDVVQVCAQALPWLVAFGVTYENSKRI